MRKSFISLKKSLFLGFVFAIFLLSKYDVSAFGELTHRYVTEKGIEILLDLGEEYKKFYDAYAIEMLVEYCIRPDEDEADGFYKDHFYNIVTGKNFMGEKNSAMTKFEDHFDSALVAYKSENLELCWEELGRSLHFIEDMNTPVHSGYTSSVDAMRKLYMHSAFEKRCVDIQDAYIVTMKQEELDYFLDNSLEEIGKMCSRISGDNFFALEKGYVPEDILGMSAIITAQKIVAGVLYKFYHMANHLN